MAPPVLFLLSLAKVDGVDWLLRNHRWRPDQRGAADREPINAPLAAACPAYRVKGGLVRIPQHGG
jgi:hypothetical protein